MSVDAGNWTSSRLLINAIVSHHPHYIVLTSNIYKYGDDEWVEVSYQDILDTWDSFCQETELFDVKYNNTELVVLQTVGDVMV